MNTNIALTSAVERLDWLEALVETAPTHGHTRLSEPARENLRLLLSALNARPGVEEVARALIEHHAEVYHANGAFFFAGEAPRMAARVLALFPASVGGDLVHAPSRAENHEGPAQPLASDHALVGWAMCVQDGRWEEWSDGRGEFCFAGLRHATRLDEFGVPILTDFLRALLTEARDQSRAAAKTISSGAAR